MNQQERYILELIADATIEVMTFHPEHRPQWFDEVRRIHRQADSDRDTQMVTLLDAVTELLLGDPIDSIKPSLESSYNDCWMRILQGIKSEEIQDELQLTLGITEHYPLTEAEGPIGLRTTVNFLEAIGKLPGVALENVHQVVEEFPNLLSERGLGILAAEIYEDWTDPDIGGLKVIAQCLELRVPELAYLLARRGEFSLAVVWMERIRTRAYREFLSLSTTSLSEVTGKTFFALDSAMKKVYDLQIHQWAQSSSAISLLIMSWELYQARRELDQIIGGIRKTNPRFMPIALSFDDIASAPGESNPLVYIFTTSQGSIAIIIKPGVEALTDSDVVWLTEFDLDDLDQVLGIDTSQARRPLEDNHKLTLFKGKESIRGVIWKRNVSERDYLPSIAQADYVLISSALGSLLPLLGKRLMGPIANRLAELNIDKATLVPCGRLALLPLHAAVIDNKTFLDRFEVSYVPSALFPPKCREALATDASSQALLAVVDSGLDFARIEIDGILESCPWDKFTILNDNAATHDAVLNELSGHTYMHFACHGRFILNEPMRSGLELPGGESLGVIDLLSRARTKEIGSLLREVRLVVLSACQTSVTDFIVAPDESLGLASVCLLAGVPGVVGTLWPVNDLSTALLMIKFYEYHLKGDASMGAGPMQPAVALRNAQLWLRDVTNAELSELFEKYRMNAPDRPDRSRMAFELASERFREHTLRNPDERPFAHPYYWAPFVFYGA